MHRPVRVGAQATGGGEHVVFLVGLMSEGHLVVHGDRSRSHPPVPAPSGLRYPGGPSLLPAQTDP
jgi:hypothetical protein